MNETLLLEHLEQIANRLGVDLRYENLGIGGIRSDGGYCRVSGKPMILINRKDSRRRKILVSGKVTQKAQPGRYLYPTRGAKNIGHAEQLIAVDRPAGLLARPSLFLLHQPLCSS